MTPNYNFEYTVYVSDIPDINNDVNTNTTFNRSHASGGECADTVSQAGGDQISVEEPNGINGSYSDSPQTACFDKWIKISEYKA